MSSTIFRGRQVRLLPGFRFSAEGHKYFLNGQELASVTRVLRPLQDFSNVSPAVLQAAAEKGSLVHNALFLHDCYNEQVKQFEELYPAWDKVKAAWGWEAEPGQFLAELPICSPSYYLAGRFDRLFAGKKHDWLVDIKTGQPSKLTGLQLAAYAGLAIENGLTTAARVKLAEVNISVRVQDPFGEKVFQLIAEPTVKVYDFKNNWQIFRSQLTVFNFLSR